MNQNIITIDGPAASGKSSLSRELARKLGWSWVSTGAFYRALGYVAHKEAVDLEDCEALLKTLSKHKIEVLPHKIQTEVYIDDNLCPPEDIYSEENGGRASTLSKHQPVRDAVLDLQRDCYKKPGLIAEGRDCGTVVFPKAQLKIFLEADTTSRALRRGDQDKKLKKDLGKMKKDLEQRDKQDSTRKSAPLTKASDSWVLDTSHLSLDEVSTKAFEKAKEIFSL